MPFEETHVVDERTRFIEDVHRSLKSFTAICERYGISRTTGYKWLARWKAHTVWFVQLQILPEFIEPASPQQNGRHENMHLVLKRRTTRPPRSNMRTQQRAFRNFMAEFNHIRPHEALDGAVPADLYRPSPRPFPKTLEPITYPGHFETRLVSYNGGIRWYRHRVPVSSTSTSVPSG